MMRFPPCAVSIRLIVVPIGSDGVMPQRGCPPSLERASSVELDSHRGVQENVHEALACEAEALKMPVVGENDLRRGDTAIVAL